MAGDILVDRYALGDEIGRGAAGRVHRAHDQRLDRPVAVKVLTDLQEPAVARFRREAAAAARIRHRNVVTLHDAGVDDDRPFIVMHLVDGPSLAQRVADDGPLDPDRSLRLAADVLAGLDATHRAGVLHRDLTPRNILFDSDGTAMLADFGIARGMDDPTITGERTIMGTRPFVAPERLRGEPATPASDLFAIGVTLRYAITGDYARDVPDNHVLAPLIRACTAPDPRSRPAGAVAAADRLAALTRPPDPLPRTEAIPLTQLPEADPAEVAATRALPRDRAPLESPTTRPVAVLVILAGIVLAGLIAGNAITADDTDDQPTDVPAGTAAPDGPEAPSFDPDNPEESLRELARWLRTRDLRAP